MFLSKFYLKFISINGYEKVTLYVHSSLYDILVALTFHSKNVETITTYNCMKLSLESQGASRCDVLVKSLLPGNRVWFSAPIVVKLVQIQQRFFFREATHQTDFSLRPAIPVA